MAACLLLYCPRCETPVTGFNPWQELDSPANIAYFQAWHQDHVCPGRRTPAPVLKPLSGPAPGEQVDHHFPAESSSEAVEQGPVLTSGDKAKAIVDAVGIQRFVKWMANMQHSDFLTSEASLDILYRNHVVGRK